VHSDQTVILTAIESAKVYPDALRRVTYFDLENERRLKFLTNNFFLPALTIAKIYKSRWMVELFLFGAKNILHLVNQKPRGMLPSARRLIDYLLIHVPAWLREHGI
jgi:IS4 transposase